MQYLELAVKAVKEAQRLGAYSAEAYLLDAKSLTIEIANQTLEMLKLPMILVSGYE